MNINRLLASLTALAILLAAVAFGSAIYFSRINDSLRLQLEAMEDQSPVQIATIQTPEPEKPASEASEDAQKEIDGLNAYIDRLERENAAFRQQLMMTANDNGRSGNDGRPGDGRRHQRQSLEELKESNPEAYERIQEARQRMQEEVELRRKRMDEYFASLDTSKLTGEQQATISDFQNAVQEIREGMQDGPPSPELRESFRQVMELRDEVQDILLQELGSRLGTDATALSEGVQEVLSIMGAAGPGGGFRPGPPPPGR